MSFACDMKALSPADRERHRELVTSLGSTERTVVELDNGYEVEFLSAREVWPVVAEWAGLESRCCPFLTLEFRLANGGELLSLRVTGAEGVKPFLLEELGSLFE